VALLRLGFERRKCIVMTTIFFSIQSDTSANPEIPEEDCN
jgi:hypothetical protein